MRRPPPRGFRDLAALRVEVTLAKVGDWTKPYRCPPGTAAVRIVAVVGDVLQLSDGSSMHRSHFRRAEEGYVAP